MKIEKKEFGVLSDGSLVELYILTAGELKLTLSTYGAALVSLFVPCRQGTKDDVLLGYTTLGFYTHNSPYLGVTVGRFANRIAEGTFVLDSKTYTLYKNDGENTLHGGRRAFDKKVWKAEAYKEKGGVFVRFELESPDGEEGFPGAVKAIVTYGITVDTALICDYKAKVTQPCPINLTNHAYFNLKGEGNGTILDHELLLHASQYLPVTNTLIPTGVITPVEGSPFDFTKRKPIGKDISQVPGGYDHCFVVDGESGTLRPCAEVYEPLTGRSLVVKTTQPGVQFYSGNFLNNEPGKHSSSYNKHSGFCLETQHFPDSVHHSNFPSCIISPDKKYHEKSTFTFTW
jgi:aldose 1-epimerase